MSRDRMIYFNVSGSIFIQRRIVLVFFTCIFYFLPYTEAQVICDPVFNDNCESQVIETSSPGSIGQKVCVQDKFPPDEICLDMQTIDSEATIPTESGLPNLKEFQISGKQLKAYDWAFEGENGNKFKMGIREVARKVGVNSGLLAENLLAEARRSNYLSRKKVNSFAVGADDFYESHDALKSNVPQASTIKYTLIGENINEMGRAVKTVEFHSGRDAMMAHASFLKYYENRFEGWAREKGKDFKKLSKEIRFSLLRMAFNAGLGKAKSWLEKTWEEGDVVLLKRKLKEGEKKKWYRRAATIHAIRAIYLSETRF